MKKELNPTLKLVMTALAAALVVELWRNWPWVRKVISTASDEKDTK